MAKIRCVDESGKPYGGGNHPCPTWCRQNNVLATVGELAGLQEDLLAAGGADSGRLAEIAGQIGAQVERGRELTLLLRTLAHSVDADDAPLDLRASADEAVALCRRFAELRGVELAARVSGSAPAGTGRPFDLLHVLGRALLAGIESAGSGETATLSAEADDEGLRVLVTAGGRAPETEEGAGEERLALARLVGALGGTLEARGAGDRSPGLELGLPPGIRGGRETGNG